MMLKNLIKSAVAVVVSPLDVVVDICTLGESAYNGKGGPFPRTAKRLDQAAKAFDAAVQPDSGEAG